MSLSIEQKVDFLLKKIGYTVSKTGLAEEVTAVSGTKKAAFSEAIPSPLIVSNNGIWNQSNDIPFTPPASSTSIVQVYSVSSAYLLTEDSTVANSRAWYADDGNWIDTQYGTDYIIQVYAGNPNSGGVKLSSAGSGSDDTWFFDYSSGVLNFNGSQVPSLVANGDPVYIVGYKYIGSVGSGSIQKEIIRTSVGQFVADFFASSNYRTTKYLIQVQETGSPNFYSTEVFIMHDGSEVYMTQYGTLNTNSSPVTSIEADINSGNVRLLITPSVSNTTTKISRISLTT